jgi:hypothetical protein
LYTCREYPDNYIYTNIYYYLWEISNCSHFRYKD